MRIYNDNWSPREWGEGPYRIEIHFHWTQHHRVQFDGSNRIRIDDELTLRRVR